MKKINRISILSLSTMALLSGAVMADDFKTLPGAACQPKYSSYVYKYANGKAYNNSSGYQYWTCPMVNDANWIYNGLRGASFWMIDNHYDDNGFCTINSKSSTGDYVTSSTIYTSGASSAARGGSFGSFPIAVSGNTYFYCGIPGSYKGADGSTNLSSMVSYLWIETN